MSASAPLLAALLRAALPGLRALDLGLPSPPLLFPWLPGTLCGAADPDAVPPAEAGLLRRFRHGNGRPLIGFDREADAALLAGAPAAWGDAPERLIRLPAAVPTRGFPADALLLAPPDTPGAARARVLLLLGAGEAVERHDLLVPPPRLEAVHAALRVAAEALAGTAGGRWSPRALAISSDMTSIALLPDDAQCFAPALPIPAAALVHDLPAPAGPHGLDLTRAQRVRLLLGTAPARLRVFLGGEDARSAVLFGDGRRLDAVPADEPNGETRLEAEPTAGAGAFVLGVAVPAPGRATLTRLELLP